MPMKLQTSLRAVALATALFFAVPAQAEDDFSLNSARDLYASGAWELAREAFEDAFNKAPENSVQKAEASLELGTLLWEQGEYAAAETRVKDALERARALKLEETLGRLLLSLGHIEVSLGKLRQAEATLKLCNKSATDYKDIHTAALCRIQLRFVQKLRGQPVLDADNQKDLALLRNSDRDLMIGTALAKSSEMFIRTGEHAVALDMLNQAQARFEAAKSTPAQARNRLRRVQLYQDMGRWGDAARDMKGLIEEFQSMNNRPSLVTAYALAARQADQSQNTEDALKLYNRSLQLAKQVRSPQMVANSQLALCEFHARHRAPQAVGACTEARQSFTKAGIPDLAARAQVLQARMLHADGQLNKAREAYLEAVKELEKRTYSDGDRYNVGALYANLCQIELQLQSKGALNACRESLKKLNNIQNRNADVELLIAASHQAAGVGAINLNSAKEARTHFESAITLFEKNNDLMRAADVYLRLGRLQTRIDNGDPNASFQRLLEITGTRADMKDLRIQGRTQLAQWLMEKESWDLAHKQLSLLIAESAGEANTLPWAHQAMARVELKKSNRDKAIDHLKLGLIEAKKASDKEMINDIEASLKKLGVDN